MMASGKSAALRIRKIFAPVGNRATADKGLTRDDVLSSVITRAMCSSQFSEQLEHLVGNRFLDRPLIYRAQRGAHIAILVHRLGR